MASEDIEVFGFTRIAELKRLALLASRKRSRLVLHAGAESPVQEMVIALHRDSYIRPHRHPAIKSESYHVIDGQLMVRIFDDTGELATSFVLNATTPLYRLRGGWFHQPVALTEFAIYHETYAGPFDKEKDVEYALWAAEEK